jgi:hypothetical protein
MGYDFTHTRYYSHDPIARIEIIVPIQPFVSRPANLLTFEESSKSDFRTLLIREEVTLFEKCFHLE